MFEGGNELFVLRDRGQNDGSFFCRSWKVVVSCSGVISVLKIVFTSDLQRNFTSVTNFWIWTQVPFVNIEKAGFMSLVLYL